ncbi:ferredoxin-2, mitochondrial isoform X1 [Scophthalmus maximus]|uniref:ferredoxin-2, mitochondrial isoform X1 n=1 Tax=Scophthalmus maximus TaxID=52904 RepID=UPI001FA8CC13|nr:ferredoxin-2, mitochondrial isoform X1 [Scophthalmus maximus]XP_035493648.2 ferredoxin-2, mitochondrial isoform X1 [Scophthalmus maximus]XP_035493649.2 ferredoxin-2, mitochondrial isoform X1 [Scophthalmus maximus]XP_035493650.2 ferredoxin-2, mitochondrial isoform X1 [Scophthalmus maximus]XP_047189997.1 ferredoxin-2, mitochondrial isoform X1 [Scophthalmus maximus]
MNIGPRTQATFKQGNQRTAEQDAPHSALVYLLQEVSRLASPVHNSFLDTSPPSKWLSETSRQHEFMVEKEDGDAHFFPTFDSSCQHSLSGVLPFNQVNKVREESHSSESATLVEPHRELNSPWKVLSLINLQCERLLHRRDGEESNPSLVSSARKSGHQTAKSSTAATEQGVGSDSVNVKNSLRPSLIIYKRREIIPELVKENAASSSQPQLWDKREAMFRQFFSDKHVPYSENALSQAHVPSAPLNTQMTFNLNEDTSLALSKSAITLDWNANIALTSDALCDNQLSPPSATLPSPQSVSLFLSATERCHSLPKKDNKITGSNPECTHATREEKSPPDEQQKSLNYNVPSAKLAPELRPVQTEGIAPLSSQQWRTKTPRKQSHPSRSVDIQDPDIQGVTFSMGTELDDSREQCRLLITSKYSKELFKSVRKPRMRTRTSQKSLKSSSSDEESDLTTAVSKGKICASCCTRKTPMWRDAEDGTPLCNACGIRYKKYRVRCVNCWHIPRKAGNTNSCCLKCGNLVRLTSAQRKHTT